MSSFTDIKKIIHCEFASSTDEFIPQRHGYNRETNAVTKLYYSRTSLKEVLFFYMFSWLEVGCHACQIKKPTASLDST